MVSGNGAGTTGSNSGASAASGIIGSTVGGILNPGPVAGFALGLIPGYDLFQALQNPDSAAFDYLVGAVGILGPVGKGVGLALKEARVLGEVAKGPLLLNGPISVTEKGLAHVVERHTVNDIAKFAGKSKFNEGENLSALINSGTQQRMVEQANGNFARTWDVGRQIGLDRVTGGQTSVMTVITRPNGELVTSFPGRP